MSTQKIYTNYPEFSAEDIPEAEKNIVLRSAPLQGDDPLTWVQIDRNLEILRHSVNSIIDDIEKIGLSSSTYIKDEIIIKWSSLATDVQKQEIIDAYSLTFKYDFPGNAGTVYRITNNADSANIQGSLQTNQHVQTADLNYLLTIQSQSITFQEFSSKSVLDEPFQVAASATSGLPVTFQSLHPSVATVTPSGQVSILSSGTAIIRASQGGDSTYEAAPDFDRTLLVTKAAQEIVIAQVVNTNLSNSQIPLVATSSSGLPVIFSVAGQGGSASITAEGNLALEAAGQVVVTASQAGDDNYMPATNKDMIVNIADDVTDSDGDGIPDASDPFPNQQTQIITWPGQQGSVDTLSSQISLNGTSSSGLALSYVSGNTSVVEVGESGGNPVLIIKGAGNSLVTAVQAGSANYLPAEPITRSYTVGLGDVDADGDGVPASQDVDDNDPNRASGNDQDGDGIDDEFDTDIDGDGVPNDSDNFPTDPNRASGTDSDGDGIDDEFEVPIANNPPTASSSWREFYYRRPDLVQQYDILDSAGSPVLSYDRPINVPYIVYDVASRFTDSDGDSLTFSATANNGATAVIENAFIEPIFLDQGDPPAVGSNRWRLTVTPTNDFVGDIIVSVTGSDGQDSTTVQFYITYKAMDLDGDGFDQLNDIDDLDPNVVDGVDTDGDGIDDVVDSDRDGDGFSNDVDLNPDDPSVGAPDIDDDGIADSADSDKDGDGVPNEDDTTNMMIRGNYVPNVNTDEESSEPSEGGFGRASGNQRQKTKITVPGIPSSEGSTQELPRVDFGGNSFLVIDHSFETGDALRFTEVGESVGGLTLNQVYFVIKVNDDEFKLSTAQGEAAINLTEPSVRSVLKFEYIEPSEAADYDSSTGMAWNDCSITLPVTSASDPNIEGAHSFQFTVFDHNFSTGDAVIYTTLAGGSPHQPAGHTGIGGLVSGTTYYIIRGTDNTFRLANSLYHANNGTDNRYIHTTGSQIGALVKIEHKYTCGGAGAIGGANAYQNGGY